MEDLL
jgi:hypothetical protein